MQTTPGTSLSPSETHPDRPDDVDHSAVSEDTGATDHRALDPGVEPERYSRRLSTAVRLAAGIAALVLALDQGTKWWAEQRLTNGEPRELVGELLQLRLTYNPGAAFSLGTGYTIVLTCIALGVVVVVVAMAGRINSLGWGVALGLLLGGALGNVTDRLFRPPGPFRGHVVDFLELPNWPVFNIADSAISVAAVLFVVLSLRGVALDGSRIGAAAATEGGPVEEDPSDSDSDSDSDSRYDSAAESTLPDGADDDDRPPSP